MEAAGILLILAVGQDIGEVLEEAPQVGQLRGIFGIWERETWRYVCICIHCTRIDVSCGTGRESGGCKEVRFLANTFMLPMMHARIIGRIMGGVQKQSMRSNIATIKNTWITWT